MLAHHQGGLLNTAQFARNLGVDVKTAGAYLDLTVDLLLVRRLPPWHANLGKRQVKSPKVYVRDSGLVHALLAIPDKETLLAHPVVGQSWEGFVVENLLAGAPEGVSGHFYRSAGGGAGRRRLSRGVLAWRRPERRRRRLCARKRGYSNR